MILEGQLWRDDSYWLIEIPIIDVMTQAKSKKEALFMIGDAVELLVNDKNFKFVVLPLKDNKFHFVSQSLEILLPFILQRLRRKNNLTIRETAKRLGHKSHTAYARYESGQVNPSLDKFAQFVKAIEGRDLILKVG